MLNVLVVCLFVFFFWLVATIIRCWIHPLTALSSCFGHAYLHSLLLVLHSSRGFVLVSLMKFGQDFCSVYVCITTQKYALTCLTPANTVLLLSPSSSPV